MTGGASGLQGGPGAGEAREGPLTGVVGVRLQAVDHVVVGLQQHEVLGRVSVPDEDVAAVRAAHHKVVAPEAGLLYLEAKEIKTKPSMSYCTV